MIRAIVIVAALLAAMPSYGAITFRGAGTKCGVNSNTCSPGLPSGTVADDYLAAPMAHKGSGVTLQDESGWTGQTQTAHSLAALTLRFYGQIYTSGGAPTFDASNSQSFVGGIAGFSGVDTSTPLTAWSCSEIDSSVTMTAPSVSIADNDSAVIRVFMSNTSGDADNSHSAHSEGTVAFNYGTTLGTDAQLSMSYVLGQASGTTGTATAVHDGTTDDEAIACTGVLKPAASAGTAPEYSILPAQAGDSGQTSVRLSFAAADETDDHYDYCVIGVADGEADIPTGAECVGDTYSGTDYCRVNATAIDNDVESRPLCSGLAAATAYDIYTFVYDGAANYSPAEVTNVETEVFEPRLYAADFTDSDDTAIASYAEDYAWRTFALANGDSTPDGTAGSVTIQSNALSAPVETVAEGDIGTPNVIVFGDAAGDQTTNRPVIQVRRTDEDNNYTCLCRPESSFCSIIPVVGGVEGSSQTTSFLTFNGDDEIACASYGDSARLYLNGARVVTLSGSGVPEASSFAVGTWRNSDTQAWDNVRVSRYYGMCESDSQNISEGTKSLFANIPPPFDCGSRFWEDPDDYMGNSPQDWQLRDGGDAYINPASSFAGTHATVIEIDNVVSNAIETLSWGYQTAEASPGVAPAFDDVGCSEKTQSYQVNVDSGAVDFSDCLTTVGQPVPTFSVTAGSPAAGRSVGSDGVETGTPTTAETANYTITATNATGSDTLDVTATVAAQSGSAPSCSAFPDVVSEVDGAINIGMTAPPRSCTGATTFTCSPLPTNIIQVGENISGTFVEADEITASCAVCNSVGCDVQPQAFEIAEAADPELVALDITGDVLRIRHTEPVFFGDGGNAGIALTCSGGAVTATYSSGEETTRLQYSLSREIERDETCTATYTQPGDGIEDLVGHDLATYTDEVVNIGGDCGIIFTPVRPVVGPSTRTTICD